MSKVSNKQRLEQLKEWMSFMKITKRQEKNHRDNKYTREGKR
jgi:hypothetical protein